MAGENDVVIDARVETENAISELSGLFTELTSAAAAGAAGIAAAFAGAALGAIQDCIAAAVELDEKMNPDSEDKLSQKMKDLQEAYLELRAGVGDEFLPGMKTWVDLAIVGVDSMHDMVDTLETMSQIVTGGSLGLWFQGLGQAASAARAVDPRQQAREMERVDEAILKAHNQAAVDFEKEQKERQRIEDAQDREEQRLGAANRREMERAEKEEQRRLDQVAREYNSAVDRRDAAELAENRRKEAQAIRDEYKPSEKGFESRIESATEVFNRIQKAAGGADDKEKDRQQREEMNRKLRELHEKHHREDLDKLDEAIKAIQEKRDGLA